MVIVEMKSGVKAISSEVGVLLHIASGSGFEAQKPWSEEAGAVVLRFHNHTASGAALVNVLLRLPGVASTSVI